MKKILPIVLLVMVLTPTPVFAYTPQLLSIAELAASLGLGQAVNKTVYHELGEFTLTHLVVADDIIFIDAKVALCPYAFRGGFLGMSALFYVREVNPPLRRATIWNVPWALTAGSTFAKGNNIYIFAEYHFSGQAPEKIELVISFTDEDKDCYIVIPVILDEEKFLFSQQ